MMLLFLIIAGKRRQRTPPLCRLSARLWHFWAIIQHGCALKQKGEKKKSFPLFSCRFMLFHKHNLPICLKLPKRRSPGIVCRLSHTRSPKAPAPIPFTSICPTLFTVYTPGHLLWDPLSSRQSKELSPKEIASANSGRRGGGRREERRGVIRLRVAGIHYVHAK